MARRSAVILFLAVLAAGAAGAQAPVVCNGALTETDVIDLAASGVPEPRLVKMVKTCGVAFPMNKATEGRLRSAGATDAVIEAVRAAAPKPQPAPPPKAASPKGNAPPASKPPAAPAPPAKDSTNAPADVSGQRLQVTASVQSAKLVNQVAPLYPPLARQARISGTVHLHAIIAKEGTIESLQVVSGPPLLVAAALQAVRQWRYQPTLLNGAPVEVDTYIDVIFALDNSPPKQ